MVLVINNRINIIFPTLKIKKKMKKTYLLLFVFALLLSGCLDKWYCFYIKNNSEQTIYACVDFVFPDTLLPIQKPYLREITPNKTGEIHGYHINDPKFERFDKEKLTIFILDKNVVDTCSWEYIRENNLILKRYEGNRSEFVEYNGGKITFNYP